MALEVLAENYARLKGYFTETRVPYLNKKDRHGNKKTDEQSGDIDVIGHSTSNKLLVIETKGYGKVEDYSNWCKPDRIDDIYLLIEKLLNAKKINVDRWNKLFKRRKGFDEVWIVISGPFEAKQTLTLFDERQKRKSTKFVNSCIKKFNQFYEESSSEDDYIKHYEKRLKTHFKVKCRVVPIHKLIEGIIENTIKDMKLRRKRYPDTAMETFRWLIRSVGYGYLDLEKIQKSIKQKYDKQS